MSFLPKIDDFKVVYNFYVKNYRVVQFDPQIIDIVYNSINEAYKKNLQHYIKNMEINHYIRYVTRDYPNMNIPYKTRNPIELYSILKEECEKDPFFFQEVNAEDIHNCIIGDLWSGENIFDVLFQYDGTIKEKFFLEDKIQEIINKLGRSIALTNNLVFGRENNNMTYIFIRNQFLQKHCLSFVQFCNYKTAHISKTKKDACEMTLKQWTSYRNPTLADYIETARQGSGFVGSAEKYNSLSNKADEAYVKNT